MINDQFDRRKIYISIDRRVLKSIYNFFIIEKYIFKKKKNNEFRRETCWEVLKN